ncbi:MAG: glycosyl hydrolase [SAR202 cluster bacterium]|nr:glycosyl hydrolase [SAR202 cluster bacterium]
MVSIKPTVDPSMLGTLRWRNIGPHRGGRVVAVAGHPTEYATFYFGACAGGVWKTDDGGNYWRNVSDGFFNTASVGAIAVAESDPNVIYAGMGEACVRGNVAQGDGVYKSTDGGATWSHVGLELTRHISRVRVHPANPDIVYVAALGNIFGHDGSRGVFRSVDGGRTWAKVLFRSEKAGACDLVMDPANPRVLYAATWENLRRPWNFSSGGPDSAIYKTEDGGNTWKEITYAHCLPRGPRGRVGVAVAPKRPGRVWAIVESKDRGIYRSDDGGESWEMLTNSANLHQRPWYYSHLVADPMDPETVYVVGSKMYRSNDGGRTFTEVTTPHGDNHDLWIDPRNTQRMINGNDGGACVSFNGGATFSTIYNQPTAQIYRMDADNQFPYKVYGTQQDNSAISVPSRSYKGAILFSECEFVGSSESGQVAVHPSDPNIVFTGAIGSSDGGGDAMLRYDRRTGQTQVVSVWPEYVWGWGVQDHKYRFQWTYPLLFSPHDPNTIYAAAEVVFRSTDQGMSWKAFTPDLTRNDRTKMGPSGGDITHDTTFVEHFGTIFSFAESPHKKGVFWAGSDDGLIHISKDNGKTWKNITPPGLPEWSTVNMIELSRHDPAKAYVAATRYRLDDHKPYLFKTSDYGKTWTKIVSGIDDRNFSRVVREDTEKPGLLYAGSEYGIYVSFNDGESWQSLRGNLPAVGVHDLKVKGNELAAATHGRSFWVLDDLAVLRQAADSIRGEAAHLFAPASAYRLAPDMAAGRTTGPGTKYMLRLGAAALWHEKKHPNGDVEEVFLDAGKNPPEGVVVHYYLKDRPEGEVTLTFQDEAGNTIRTFTPKPPEEAKPSTGPAPVAGSARSKKRSEKFIHVEPGMNRFVWDMRYPGATRINGQGDIDPGHVGPYAVPGRYKVTLKVGVKSYTQPFELVKEPRIATIAEDFKAHFDLLMRIRDRVTETHEAINRIRSVRRQIEEWSELAKGKEPLAALRKDAEGICAKLSEIEEELIQTKSIDGMDVIALPTRINAKISELASVVANSDTRPTRQSYDVLEHLSAKLAEQTDKLKALIDGDVAKFNMEVRKLNVPAIVG